MNLVVCKTTRIWGCKDYRLHFHLFQKWVPRAWNPAGLNLYSDRIRSDLCVDYMKLFSHVVHHPFHSLLARVNVSDHLEQLVAIVEVVQEGHSVAKKVILSLNFCRMELNLG